MTSTLELPVTVRAHGNIAPPEEVNSNEWWMAAARFCIEVIYNNLDVFQREGLVRPNISTWDRTLDFAAYSLRELKVVLSMLPQPHDGKWDKASDGSPRLEATIDGWNFRVSRYDLTCELVETGEVEEYEAEEVIEPALKQVVTKTRPVTVKECPPIFGE